MFKLFILILILCMCLNNLFFFDYYIDFGVRNNIEKSYDIYFMYNNMFKLYDVIVL